MPKITLATFNIAPPRSSTRKYTDLGPKAVERLRRLAARHGYGFRDAPADPEAHPVCWEKFGLILAALDESDWVIWVDSDAMPTDLGRSLAPIVAERADFVTQCPVDFLAPTGWDAATCHRRMPFNSGVFAVRKSEAARELLRRAAALREDLPREAEWHGLGDQEAIVACLPASGAVVAYRAGLQAHPLRARERPYFVHFYGNRAEHLFDDASAGAVIARWHAALDRGDRLPPGAPRYHWAVIQNLSPEDGVGRRSPERFLYRRDQILRSGDAG